MLGLTRSESKAALAVGTKEVVSPQHVIEEPSSEPCLRFRVLSNDGGEASSAYSASNLLVKDSSCFCSTERENVTLIFEYAGGPCCFLESVEIVNPSSGFSAPVSQGVVYACWDLPNSKDSVFSEVRSLQDYRAKMQERLATKGSLSETDPIGFFDMSGSNRVVVSLPAPRAARFVVVQLLRPKFSFNENMDLQFVGLRGSSRPRGFASGAFC